MDERIENWIMIEERKINKFLKEQFGSKLKFGENLSKYSWFNLGGPAEIFFRPDNKDQLKKFLLEMNKNDYKTHFLGAGSNTLIRDGGIKGAVIKLGSQFSGIKKLDQNTIQVGAATLDRKVADFAKENGIGNMEFLSCIPGSIGGAIIMNSGCYGSEISNILKSINIIDENGKEQEFEKKDIEFYYRGSNLPKNYLILSAKLQGILASKQTIEKKQNDLINKKKQSQPSQVKTGGSTFKNSKEKKAWMLIKETGCDKLYIGDAKISEKHCNFFINDGKATASDIEKLITKVKKEISNKTGVNLELEVKIVGYEK